MTAYATIDYLPDLSGSKMSSAGILTFQPYESDSPYIAWDYSAVFYTSADYALLSDNFVFEAKEGATYDIYSSSLFDPFILRLYDYEGDVIAADDGTGSYGMDHIKYTAPYTGEYYVTASWDQGNYDKFVSLSVYEDIDTMPTPPVAPPPAQPTEAVDLFDDATIDRIFDWGEHAFSNLLPEHSESQDIFDYYARTYSNGNAVGEKDDNIYFYDGDEITLVGTVDTLLTLADLGGFG